MSKKNSLGLWYCKTTIQRYFARRVDRRGACNWVIVSERGVLVKASG